MQVEVEIKAWVDDPAALEKKLDKHCNFKRTFIKKDVYYKTPSNKKKRVYEVRVRNDGERTYVTFKDKIIEDGIEVNKEREFNVSDADTFEIFINKLGCVPFIKKTKTGRLYDKDGLNIELVEVEGLGSFIEIEKIIKSSDPDEIEIARVQVLARLQLFNIQEDKIESRYYIDMLAGKK